MSFFPEPFILLYIEEGEPRKAQIIYNRENRHPGTRLRLLGPHPDLCSAHSKNCKPTLCLTVQGGLMASFSLHHLCPPSWPEASGGGAEEVTSSCPPSQCGRQSVHQPTTHSFFILIRDTELLLGTRPCQRGYSISPPIYEQHPAPGPWEPQP
jgi:hypothetical protein